MDENPLKRKEPEPVQEQEFIDLAPVAPPPGAHRLGPIAAYRESQLSTCVNTYVPPESPNALPRPWDTPMFNFVGCLKDFQVLMRRAEEQTIMLTNERHTARELVVSTAKRHDEFMIMLKMETARLNDIAQRNTAEDARLILEREQIAAERVRQIAEAERLVAEQARQTVETELHVAERARHAAEKERFVKYVQDTTSRLKRKAAQLREQSDVLKQPDDVRVPVNNPRQ